MKTILDFFSIQERILKNVLLIRLIYALFLPETTIKLSTTINKIEPNTSEYLAKEGKTPKTAIYDLNAIFQSPNVMKIGLKFEKLETNWKLTYNTGSTSIKNIVNDIFDNFSIHPAKTETCFKVQSMPETFKIYLQRYECAKLWKTGIGRYKLFSLERKDVSLNDINFDEIEKYNKMLEEVLKKYQTFAKILLKLVTKSTCSISNSYESFVLNYNYELHCIHIKYRNDVENKYFTSLVNVTDFNPTNMDKIDIPLSHLIFMN